MEFVFYGIDYKHKRGEFCARKILPFYLFSYFLTDYSAEIGGEMIEGKAGDYMIMEPGEIVYHGASYESKEGFRNDWAYIKGEDLKDLLSKYPLPLNKPFRANAPFILRHTIEKIHKEKSLARIGKDDKCNLILSSAIIDLYRSYIDTRHISPEEKLNRARGEIMTSSSKPWTLSEMAKLTDYSESRFSALYKKIYGISPISDLINQRLEQAKLLMIYEDTPLSEICEAVGFSSIYYFSKCFKKKEGLCPSAYKESKQAK